MFSFSCKQRLQTTEDAAPHTTQHGKPVYETESWAHSIVINLFGFDGLTENVEEIKSAYESEERFQIVRRTRVCVCLHNVSAVIFFFIC